MLINWLVDCL